MKPAPTLIDSIYRATFVAMYDKCDPRHELRNLMQSARRFILDERMAGFMLDLSVVGLGVGTTPRQRRRNADIIEGFRVGARLPHKVTWIEYPILGMYKYATFADERPEFRAGLLQYAEYYSMHPGTKAGWLMQQHKSVETAFVATWCSHTLDDEVGIAPISYVWCTDDAVLPWRQLKADMASELVMVPVDTDAIGVIRTPFYAGEHRDGPLSDDDIDRFVRESAGDTRMMMALLSCINDVPVTARAVTAAKGFVARGSYRKFLDHTTITLSVPATFRLAKQIVVGVSRRRAHEVRGHWRKDHWHPGSITCLHLWNADAVCTKCGGHRLWIPEHQRGDASLGFVTHDYEVHH